MPVIITTASSKRHSWPALLILVSLFLSGCATPQNNHDPIEGINRGTEVFNDSLDRITLKPVARGYKIVFGPSLRKAVSNFYDNITYPNTILNAFLQGKTNQGFQDFARFIINSSIGLAGLLDVATDLGLKEHKEDLGQTLAVWGASQGAYLVYPVLGSNSVRNTPDFISATATDGLFWASFVLAPQVSIPLAVLKYVDRRARLLDASDMRDELALDPYVFTREAWRQNREYLIYDGNPPAREEVNGEEDDWEENGDDWEDEPDIDSEDNASGVKKNSISKSPRPVEKFKPRIRISN